MMWLIFKLMCFNVCTFMAFIILLVNTATLLINTIFFLDGMSSARCPSCLAIKEVYASEQDCLVCRAYKRHIGKRYWGHTASYHPTGYPCCPKVKFWAEKLNYFI